MEKSNEDAIAITYHAKVSDIDGHRREFSFAEQVSASELQRLRSDREYSIEYLSARCCRQMSAMMQAEPWVCSAREDECRERAVKLVFTPMNYIHKDPPCIHDIGPIPICRDPKCNVAAHLTHREIAKMFSRECQKQGITAKGESSFYSRKARVCANCGRSGEGSAILTCGRCRIAYYCNRDCQTNHWKIHRKGCADNKKA